MGVFWSGTDVGTIKQLGMGGWFTATVFNKRKEMKSAFVQSSPVRLVVSDVTTAIEAPVEATHPEWDKEYEDNVTIKSFQSSIIGFHMDDDDRTGSQMSLAELFEDHNQHWRNDSEKKDARGESTGIEAEEPTEPDGRDYTQEMQTKLDNLWAQYEAGMITEEQYSKLEEAIEDEYELSEEEIEEENDAAVAAQEDEKEEDDLVAYTDNQGEIHLRKRT
jgi:hypothetical protein